VEFIWPLGLLDGHAMTKKLFAIVLLLATPNAIAQESYTVPISAGNQLTMTDIVRMHNEKICWRLGLADNCTQAQACTAANAAGGASCTAAQARAVAARVYTNNTAGREEFHIQETAVPALAIKIADLVSHNQERMCRNWGTFNQTQKDNLCTAAGLSAGCKLCN